jgi:hypothetical protein
VELAFDLPTAAETLLGFTVIALVVLVVIRMMRSSQPDPKMTLLLSLMSDFPKDPGSRSTQGGDSEGGMPGEDLGPFGPSGFSLAAPCGHILGGADEVSPGRRAGGIRQRADGGSRRSSPVTGQDSRPGDALRPPAKRERETQEAQYEANDSRITNLRSGSPF